jgi:arabinose-5-phosphate isomerase
MKCALCNTLLDDIGTCYNPACSHNTLNKIERYSEQINEGKNSVRAAVHSLLSRIRNHTKTFFFAGIGKSAHIVRKCVATWQSLGLQAHVLLIQDMFHGDMGILKEGDMIIYISNSGNTDELLTVSNYIRQNFNIFQIAITNNPSSKLDAIVNHAVNICNFKIKESDTLNMVPSVSAVFFMMLLDTVGIHMAEMNGITMGSFKRNHPGGDLGKRETT